MITKIIVGILTLLVVVAIGLSVVIAMQPTDFHVERSLTMAAPPQAPFEQVNDFHKWEGWSPWLKVDPNAKGEYSGPAAGEGAIFSWAGNDEVGEGSMTILESEPHERIRIQLHFIKPFEDTATTDFLFEPIGEQTKVTWTMDGQHDFISKAMCLFVFDMDEMIGSKYEEGLASMKKIVESEPAETAPPDGGPSEPMLETPTPEESPTEG